VETFLPDAVLELPANETAPAICRAALVGLASAAGATDAQLDDLKVVVSEVVLNAISHGASDSGQVRVELGVVDGEVRVAVLDGGIGIRDERGDGMGMSVLRQLTDSWRMDNRTDASGVRVAFSKRI
jgi:anti-sigma regulatory factor (Ser/Thr protein kinase)